MRTSDSVCAYHPCAMHFLYVTVLKATVLRFQTRTIKELQAVASSYQHIMEIKARIEEFCTQYPSKEQQQ